LTQLREILAETERRAGGALQVAKRRLRRTYGPVAERRTRGT
jgi:hypothetical protein